MVVQKQRDTGAALRLLCRLLKNQNVEPQRIVPTDFVPKALRSSNLV